MLYYTSGTVDQRKSNGATAMERNNSELPVLIAQTGPLNGQRWLIAASTMIGRDGECDIVVPDRQVSRYHTRISITAEGVMLEDLGSKNGTFCNGNKVGGPEYIQDGDTIQVALVQSFVFLSSDSTLPLEGPSSGVNERVGRLYLDGKARRVWIADHEIVPPLSVPQFRLLQALYMQPGKVISRQELIEATWSEEEALGVSEQALDALVRRLRDRLAELDPDHVYIVTARGYGLRMDNPKN
jgi:DNA-binding winged helix-turn-helix (wHTH) protein